MASVLKVNEIQSDTSLPLVFSIDNVERARIDTSGNVGIGAASPGARLHVSGSNPAGYIANYVENTASNGYARLDLRIGSSGASGVGTVAYAPGIFMKIGPDANDTTTPLVFATNNATERMRIDSSGNVGIGSSPIAGQKFSVQAATADNTAFALVLRDSASNNLLYVRNDGLLQVVSPLGLGYGTGSGGTVTQATSRTTAVTINKPTGKITMFTAAGSTTPNTFTVNNSLVAATDTILVNLAGGNTNVYYIFATGIGAGSFTIIFWTTGGTASDTPVINFSVIKGAQA